LNKQKLGERHQFQQYLNDDNQTMKEVNRCLIMESIKLWTDRYILEYCKYQKSECRMCGGDSVRESEKQSEGGRDAARSTHVTAGKMKVLKHKVSVRDVAKFRRSNARVKQTEYNTQLSQIFD
jgi:hypothetical protein